MTTPLVCAALSERAHAAVSEQEANEIAVEGYIYLYPPTTIEVTRRVATNVEPKAGL